MAKKTKFVTINTNGFVDKKIPTKTVRCPHCKSYLSPIPLYVVNMICWCCDQEFRIEKNPNKFVGTKSSPDKGEPVREIIRVD